MQLTPYSDALKARFPMWVAGSHINEDTSYEHLVQKISDFLLEKPNVIQFKTFCIEKGISENEELHKHLLCTVIQKENEEIFNYFIDSSPNISKLTRAFFFALRVESGTSHLSVFEVEAGRLPERPSLEKTKLGNRIAKKLIENGANVNKGITGFTPLYYSLLVSTHTKLIPAILFNGGLIYNDATPEMMEKIYSVVSDFFQKSKLLYLGCTDSESPFSLINKELRDQIIVNNVKAECWET